MISQTPDYPAPGSDSVYPGGLVVKLWRDGHIVRATLPDTVGKTCVAGMVERAVCDRFFASLGSSAALQLPQDGGIPPDSATETITLRRDGKMSTWHRTLPNQQSAWSELELRLMKLPISNIQSLDPKSAQDMNRHEWNKSISRNQTTIAQRFIAG